jgi:hypothetical protein
MVFTCPRVAIAAASSSWLGCLKLAKQGVYSEIQRIGISLGSPYLLYVPERSGFRSGANVLIFRGLTSLWANRGSSCHEKLTKVGGKGIAANGVLSGFCDKVTRVSSSPRSKWGYIPFDAWQVNAIFLNLRQGKIRNPTED